jgi:hypothetical protein
MMMKSALKTAALFAVYSTIGYGGDWAVDLVAQTVSDLRAPDEVAAPHVAVDVEVPDVVVEVKPTIVSRVQVRHSGSCTYEGEREHTVAVSEGDRLRVRAGSGQLHVEGEAGLEEVVVVGVLCASDEAYLAELRVEAGRSSDGSVEVVTHYPSDRFRTGGRDIARIDLTVLVPEGMAVDIDDSSGDMTVLRTGDLRIEDSSGSLRVTDIDGSVEIDDSSGDVSVRDVTGSVEIEDGSGGLDVSRIGGSLRLSDGSGGIEVTAIEGDVVVDSDGSGSIEARDVGGDFIVHRDGSGGIRHSGVEGRVEIPSKGRR